MSVNCIYPKNPQFDPKYREIFSEDEIMVMEGVRFMMDEFFETSLDDLLEGMAKKENREEDIESWRLIVLPYLKVGIADFQDSAYKRYLAMCVLFLASDGTTRVEEIQKKLGKKHAKVLTNSEIEMLVRAYFAESTE